MSKKFNIHDWQSKYLHEQDDRSEKDKEFDQAQAMSKLTPDDQDKLGKIQQMMDKERTDSTLNYKGGATLGPKIAMLLPEDYNIKNFAKDIGSVIEVEYGKHNIKTFLDELEEYFSIYSDEEKSLKR
jgi:rRNA maturation endonuclease Nob1|tara:strand:+ start:382 stop:762 length:381 start_codon:yes stop_codon:yes gene_type:complete